MVTINPEFNERDKPCPPMTSPLWRKWWGFALISFVTCFFLLWILRLFDSFYEEILAAAVFGGLSFLRSVRSKKIIQGILIAPSGWLIGLAVSDANGQSNGLGIGTWLMTSLAIFLIIALQFVKKKKIILGILVFLLGAVSGVVVEALQILPSFIYFLRFQDYQAMALFGAVTVIVLPAASLSKGGSLKGRLG